MFKLINLINENIKFPTAKEIRTIIQVAYKTGGFKNYGLRVLPTEIPVKEGDKLRDSTQWTYSGENTGLSLGGISTIGIFSLDKKGLDRSLRIIKNYNIVDTQLILVGGHLGKRGQDLGELIIKDGIAIKVWK